MKITTWICGILLAVAASTPALPWDYQGHEMVGAIADRILMDDGYANARQKVQENLRFTLQVAAPWPDCVRSVVHKDDGNFSYLPNYIYPEYRTPCEPFETAVRSKKISPEQTGMEDYAKRNWYNCTNIIGTPKKIGTPGGCHQTFHFADVAIQRDSYDRRYVGTSDHDIVSAINACIAVLQGRSAPAPFFIIDKKEALFLLAHFVGDIHQPLHVGAVYLDPKGTPVDPDATGLDQNTETRGGNSINVVEDGETNLHAEWDGIPQNWGVAPDAAMLADARAVPLTAGPINGWAAIWASESVKEAQVAFRGLTFSAAVEPRHGWDAHFPDKQAYDRDAEKTKRDRLVKGGARLAQLLKAIWP